MLEEVAPEKIIIFDAGIPQLGNNDLFVPEIARLVSHTILPICYLQRQASARGLRFVTPDVYLAMDKKPGALLISHLKGDYSDLFLNSFRDKVTPLLLTCQESPFIATRFYLHLPIFSGRFKNSLVFSGMKKRLSRKTAYYQMFFPQPYGFDDFQPKSFSEKKLITMISGAKSVGDWKKNILLKIVYGFSVKEIYPDRLKAVKYFSDKDGFDLFGRGWSNFQNKKFDKDILAKSYGGEVDDKFSVLKDYKFTICFENSIFPGYITEKIFDAIFAGSIPVYYGAPDITDYIPADVFIDFRKFGSYVELYDFISSMDENIYNQYLEAMERFILSDAYKIFSQEYFADFILDMLDNEFKNKRYA